MHAGSEAAAAVVTLDYMLMVMRDTNADAKRRDAMAIAAAQYLHPKVSPVEAGRHRVKTGSTEPTTPAGDIARNPSRLLLARKNRVFLEPKRC